LNGALRSNPESIGRNGLCTADGRIRYVHVRRLCARADDVEHVYRRDDGGRWRCGNVLQRGEAGNGHQ